MEVAGEWEEIWFVEIILNANLCKFFSDLRDKPVDLLAVGSTLRLRHSPVIEFDKSCNPSSRMAFLAGPSILVSGVTTLGIFGIASLMWHPVQFRVW